MNLKAKIENNITIWFLGTLLTGFLAGIATYTAVLKIAQLTVVSQDKYEELTTQKTFELGDSEVTILSPGYTVLMGKFNVGIKLDADENFNPKTKAARVWFFYPKNELATITEENKIDENVVASNEYWLEPNVELPVNLGSLGAFMVKITDYKFVPEHDRVQRLTIEIKKK